MATNMDFYINYVDADVDYATTPADYIYINLANDYLIWTAGDAVVKDLMTHEPTTDELNAAATVIDDLLDVEVTLCLLMDYSHDVGGSYYTHKVIGMNENKRFVYCFRFNGSTATIPRLEAWDTSTHETSDKNVLGAGTPVSSFVKAVKTTDSLPGVGWIGTPLAGAVDYLELDTVALVGTKELYANLKIKIPAGYSIPAAESYVLTVRHTWA